MKKKMFILTCLMAMSLSSKAQQSDMAVEAGPFQPTWESLSGWECPEWFKDVKFGIWAHWGPQCEAEDGDWYARYMYYPDTQQWNWQTSHFGSPETFGLKDLIHVWKAENWDPDKLVKLYKDAGAQYFFTLGNHHDNFDLWNSPYQEWNSVNMGPGRDIVGEWAKACKKYGLPLGVSFHASHAWTWLEPSQPYDGNLTKEDGYTLNSDGTEKWWKGYDPQELYAQRHDHSTGWDNSGTISSQWAWGNGASIPSEAYLRKFQNRVLQCINDYNPSMIYFDDTVLPFYGATDSIGLNIMADYYNHSANQHDGKQQVVMTGKILNDDQKEALLWDVERGIPDRPQAKYWQTCTCLGEWHYSQNYYNNGWYKSAPQVIRMLVDIVSKNGNLLLSVPIKADGTIDDKEEAIVKSIGAWMKDNGRSIYGTRVWKTFGEGPLAEAANPLSDQGFNENNNYSSKDVRYVTRHDTVYATIMAWPEAGEYQLKAFGITADGYSGDIAKVTLLGRGAVQFRQDNNGLYVTIPTTRCNEIAPVFEITFDTTLTSWDKLQRLVGYVEGEMPVVEAASGYNTGNYSQLALNKLKDILAETKNVSEEATDETKGKAFAALAEAWNNLHNSRSENGQPEAGTTTDLTVEKLVQASTFDRTDNSTTRFGTPKNWTVENFRVPQNNSDGTKNGIDKYPGYSCLMLGVWDDAQNSQDGDLSDARIYRKVHLDAGRYFFGGAFQNHYQIEQAYVFASTELIKTSEITSKVLAYFPITNVTDGDDLYGVMFTVPQDTDLYLGFQANLLSGQTEQEFRVKTVRLQRYADVTFDDYKKECDTALALADNAIVSDNTGYYSQEAVDALKATLQRYATLTESASEGELSNAYLSIKAAYDDFLASGRNAGGKGDEGNATDMTTDKLVETSNFTPADGCDLTTRFAAPKYWTVENFNIPQTDGSGTKAGLDKYTGQYSLMMGLWNDKSQDTQGNLSDARIYRKVSLKKGRYYFGAGFDDTWMPTKGYIFAATQLLPTADIEQKSLAWYSLGGCSKDGEYNGVYFTLDSDTDVYLGFQCDFNQGTQTQEFRATKVRLRRLDSAMDDVVVTVGSTGYSSLYYGDRALTVPANAVAQTYYIRHGDGGDVLAVSKAYAEGSVIPKATAVVIKAGEGTYTFKATTSEGEVDSDNVLRGSDVATTTSGGTVYYMLSDGVNGIGFYWAAQDGAAFTSKAHKVYLPYTPSSSTAKFFVGFDKGQATAINGILANSATARIYTLDGKLVGKTHKGILIQGGRKYINR